MEQIRVARSFVAADALAELLASEYELAAPVSCQLFSKLLRTQDNDHYLVNTGNGDKFVVRVYQSGKHLERQESDYLWELDWLLFLHENGLPVSYPLPRKDGSYLGGLLAPEGLRYYALFTLSEGEPMSVTSEKQLFVCGQQMARIHKASNGFKSDHHRQAMDLEYLVDKSVERVKAFWGDSHSADMEILLMSAAEAKDEILALINNEYHTPDSWGPIGGDFHSSSVYFNRHNEPSFFNFDLCGYGWRAYDIATFLLNTELLHHPEDVTEAFFAGYYSERPLSENEHAAISPFMTIRRIWMTGLFTRSDGIVGHTFIAPAQPPKKR